MRDVVFFPTIFSLSNLTQFRALMQSTSPHLSYSARQNTHNHRNSEIRGVHMPWRERIQLI